MSQFQIFWFMILLDVGSTPERLKVTHHKHGAGQWEESVAALMQQHFAVDALVALLRPEAPYRVRAAAAGHLLRTCKNTGQPGHVTTFNPQTVHVGEHAQVTGGYTVCTIAAAQ